LRSLRISLQLTFLAAFLVLVFLNSYPLGFDYPTDFFMRLDPYTGLSTMIAVREYIPRLLPGLVLLAVTLVLGRVFCGYVCPLGTLLDGWSRLTGRRRPAGVRPGPADVKYLILGGTLALSVWGVTLVHLVDPLTIAERSGIFLFRQITGVALETVRIYPDSAALEVRYYNLTFMFAGVLGLILGLEMIGRRFWCRNLCPLGAMLAVVARVSPVVRRIREECNSCGKCERECVFGVIGRESGEMRSGECTRCFRCGCMCPVDATSFGFGWGAPGPVSPDRRALALSLAGGLLLGGLMRGRRSADGAPSTVIRPPGAVDEDLFLAQCTRCGACIGACLTGGLQPAFLEAGWEGLWTPMLVGRRGGCESECNLCGQVCNTQAIKDLGLEEKKEVKMGTAMIDRDLCIAWKEERHCYICDEICPFDAVEFLMDEETGFEKPRVVSEDCTGCGLCEWKCPVTPPAIYATPQGAERL
jgi:polyferredoxin/NAD-dependent dihydropyrimidine dehydrogenase PreA subunit